MAHRISAAAFSLILAGSPLLAAQADPNVATPAPTGTPETRYCLRVEPLPGNLVETVKCWTRAEWAEQDVDVDKNWAKDGVSTIG